MYLSSELQIPSSERQTLSSERQPPNVKLQTPSVELGARSGALLGFRIFTPAGLCQPRHGHGAGSRYAFSACV